MTHDEIASLINRRQRQILVHSIIYYEYDENIIDDATWSKWAIELEELQSKYPKISAKQPYGEAFKNFDHSSGHYLPLRDKWGVSKALYLMRLYNSIGTSYQ